ncbi:MAG: spore germination protein [Lachnospiraceae bacterium]|nr:spore germination protein [Lachnospiraceae bacterium]
MSRLSGNFDENIVSMNALLGVERNFDIMEKKMRVGGHDASLFFIDGLTKDEMLEKLLEFFYGRKEDDMPQTLEEFQVTNLPYAESEVLTDTEDILKNLISGVTCLFLSGYSGCSTSDCRTSPHRCVADPRKDRTLRGSRDGFVETLVANTALIRRCIRSPKLCMEMRELGKSSRTDLALCYMEDRVDWACLEKIKKRIQEIDVDALTMNQESLAELLLPGHWFNPLPRFHRSERPDTAAAQILEGDIVILVDNSPAALILPTSLFAIAEEANDYYFPQITGTYLRLTRMLIMFLSIVLTPLFLLYSQRPEWIPEALRFIEIQETVHVPLILQFLILELAVDGLRLAAVPTPDMLSTPLSVIAGLVIGEFAVNSGWFNSEVMLYMAFVTLAGYSQANMELNYAVKFLRIVLLLATCWFALPGFIIGLLFIGFCFLSCRTFAGRGYLYPLVPFNWEALKRQLFRVKL